MSNQKNSFFSTKKLATMAVFAAISIILVMIVHLPIFPAVTFLEYDPADIPILLATFMFGPLSGIIMTIVVSLIQGLTVSAGSGAYGIIMHILATSALVTVAGIIYRKHKTKKRAVIGLAAGSLAMVVVMFFANMIITPLFMGLPLEAVMSLMPFILLFNFVKAGINSVVTFVIYKRISPFLHR